MIDPRVIDDVARAMTAAGRLPSSTSLRERVVARLEPRRRFAPAIGQAVALLAAMLVAATGVGLWRHATGRSGRVTIDQAIAGRQPTTMPALRPATTDHTQEHGRVDDRRSTQAAPAEEAAPLVDPEWAARAVPALPDLPALAIDGIQPTALSIPQLEVTPITTAALQVAPLDGRNR